MSRRIEDKINQAFEHATPDILDRILSDIDNEKGNVIIMTNTTNKNNKFIKGLSAVAAACVLVAGGTVGYNMIMNQGNAVDSTIYLDVNPSIELDINKANKVVEVEAKNADAIKILGEMNLEGSDINVAVNALVGSMLKNGYITEAQNSVLITVDNEDEARSEELQTALSTEIKETLAANNVEGSVVSLVVEGDDDKKNEADDLGISVGKAELITKIVASNPKYTVEELSKLSINELNLLTQANQDVTVDTVTTTGSASENAYIGIEAAKAAALAHAGVTDVTELKSDLDFEDGIMVYEVDFEVNGVEYEYDINAATGEVVKSEVEQDDDNDDLDDDNDDLDDDNDDDDNDDLDDDNDDIDDNDDLDDDNDDIDDIDDLDDDNDDIDDNDDLDDDNDDNDDNDDLDDDNDDDNDDSDDEDDDDDNDD